MEDLASAVALREHLAAVAKGHPSLVDAARQEVFKERACALVDDLKARGWPPERVIVAVKKIAVEAGLHPSRSTIVGITPVFEHDAVIAQTVRVCIERYYHAELSSGSP